MDADIEAILEEIGRLKTSRALIIVEGLKDKQ